MRNIVFAAAAFLSFASVATAGGMAEPVMEPETVATDSAAKSDSWVVLLLLVVLVATVISSDDAPAF